MKTYTLDFIRAQTARWLAWLTGCCALLWFLIRVIPKPSRAAYPCQRAAFPAASAFIVSLLTGCGGVAVFLRRHKLPVLAAVVLITGIGIFLSSNLSAFDAAAPVSSGTGSGAAAQPTPLPKWIPATKPNEPIGQAKGIFPGRVTYIRDLRATPWDGKTGKWWDEGNINQKVLDQMFSKSILSLTGADSVRAAWEKLIRAYNKTHNRGDAARKPGETVAVKINLNNTYGGYADNDNNIDQSPQSVRTLLGQLTREAGFEESAILVYDASPAGVRFRAIPDRMYNPLHREFPGVRWMDCQGKFGREKADWVEGAITYSSPETALGTALPKQVVDATYLINFALLKGHEISGITLCGKNHFGSIMFPYKDHSKYVAPRKRDITAQNALVDLMGCPNLGGKTILYILDGLYGTQTNVGDVGNRDRWNNLFNGEWSACYLMSQDPVAIDSVGLDLLYAEFGEKLGFSGSKHFPMGSVFNSDNYLIEAANGTNKTSGPYKPNGRGIGSQGAHEHWNNPKDMQYSRNLDPKNGTGIELIRVP